MHHGASDGWLPVVALCRSYLRCKYARRYHCHRMLHVLFDYGLNVKLCIAAGAVQTATWAAWVVRRRHPGRGRMLLFLVRLSLTSARSASTRGAQSLLAPELRRAWL